jgi:hypothetical protein
MIANTDKLKIISILDDTLGPGSSLKGNEQSHYCPFCHHHKKKLQINLDTQQWHCWVCDAKGKRIPGLLRKLQVDVSKLRIIYDIYGDDFVAGNTTPEIEIELRLPNEFQSLTNKITGFNPLYKRVLQYCKDRRISDSDIIKYNIGWCQTGLYAGRIIIPSYDFNNKLNYFIARSVFESEPYKYKNPPVSKNIIMFENQINWNEPITICEGVFDGLAIKRNAIPILGKFIPKKLMDSIYERGVTNINILLDNDAQEQALYYTMYFQKQGFDVKNIIPSDKDAGDMGFSEITKIIKSETTTKYEDIVLQKLKQI